MRRLRRAIVGLTYNRAIVLYSTGVVLLICPTVFAATSYVPDNFATIQGAIDGTADGGTILVRAGTYHETLTLSGRTLALQSTDGASSTIIDARGFATVVSITNGGAVTIQGFTLTNGQAAAPSGQPSAGGGVDILSDGSGQSATVNLVKNVISGNVADYGGGIAAAADASAHITLSVTGNTITGNNVNNAGGGIALNSGVGSVVELVSSGNTVSLNHAGGCGGGLFLNPVGQGALVTQQSSSDQVLSNSSVDVGGGLCIYASDHSSVQVNLGQGKVTGNGSAHGGGGIYMNLDQSSAGALVVTTSAVDSNLSEGGGGLFLVSTTSASFDFKLSGSVVSGNDGSNNSGAGIEIRQYGSASTAMIEGTDISGNRGLGAGGGLDLQNGGPLELSLRGNRIVGNGVSNSNGGGAVSIQNSSALTLDVTNNLVANNGHDLYGGGCNCGQGCAIALNDSGTSTSVMSFTNNTVAKHCGSSAFYVATAGTTQVSLTNNIMFGNDGKDLYNNQSRADITISHSDLGVIFGRFTDAGGNISADPRFVAADSGDFHLAADSPCIDTGTEQGAPTDDLEGNSRPHGSGYDMGAYEFGATPPCTGDCDGSGDVTVNELITMVNIALEARPRMAVFRS